MFWATTETLYKEMKSELYFPLRTRRDGSLYSDKSCLWKVLLRETFLTLLIAAIFVGITLLILIDPFNMGAPIP